jgi:hypothetical protein
MPVACSIILRLTRSPGIKGRGDPLNILERRSETSAWRQHLPSRHRTCRLRRDDNSIPKRDWNFVYAQTSMSEETGTSDGDPDSRRFLRNGRTHIRSRLIRVHSTGTGSNGTGGNAQTQSATIEHQVAQVKSRWRLGSCLNVHQSMVMVS